MKRFSAFVALCLASGSVAVLAAMPSAGAYGKTAQYQVAVSFNCDSTVPGACDQFGGQGGFWAWYEFDNDGTGDATGTGCGHVTGGAGPGLAGAGHENVDITGWHIGVSQPEDPVQGNVFYIDSDLTTFVGRGGPQTVPDANVGDTTVPTTPGHYSLKLAPGISAQVQVTQIPNR